MPITELTSGNPKREVKFVQNGGLLESLTIGGNVHEIYQLTPTSVIVNGNTFEPELKEYSSGNLNLIGNVTLTVDTGFNSINDISVYDSLGNEITDAIVLSKNLGIITLESNNTIPNINIKAIGKN